jgi:transcriptional regulator with XRE-family HTH domain
MSDTNKQLPYESLGSRLKRFREDNRESLAEVSGAVEIEESDLTRIEAGHERPSEDILLLLISHFGIQDDKAAELWELAGYDQRRDFGADDSEPMQQGGSGPQTLMVMIDPRVMYSDQAEIVANKQGIVINFAQMGGAKGQPLVVSKIGMSETQAKLLMSLLHQALYNLDNPGGRKGLPGGS